MAAGYKDAVMTETRHTTQENVMKFFGMRDCDVFGVALGEVSYVVLAVAAAAATATRSPDGSAHISRRDSSGTLPSPPPFWIVGTHQAILRLFLRLFGLRESLRASDHQDIKNTLADEEAAKQKQQAEDEDSDAPHSTLHPSQPPTLGHIDTITTIDRSTWPWASC